MITEVFKFLARFIFTLPPDFRADALKEIETGPQNAYFQYLTEEGKNQYLNDTTSQHIQVWLCKCALLGNIFTRVTFGAVLVLYAHDGMLGPILRWSGSALKTACLLLVQKLTG
jgi:hypothetical protein